MARTDSYQPGPVPADPAQLQRYLREEFAKIAARFDALAAGQLDRVYELPAKPRDGNVRYLDGSIAPGGVRGIYRYDGTDAAWKPLG